MANEQDPQNRFRNREDENEEEEYEEVEENGRGALIGFLILFIILFLVSTGLLFYYQFYQGSDGWHFTFKKQEINVSEAQQLKNNNKKLKASLDSLKSELKDKETKIDMLQDNKDRQGTTSAEGGADISGTYYEVQIGAFKSFDFERYSKDVTNLTFINKGGRKKLQLGKFKKPNPARAFRRDLVKLGLEDAFIVKKKNGQRIEVIESY